MSGPIHPNSMANLTKPKSRQEGHGYQYTLPKEKIDELFAHLANGMALKPAAKEAKISYLTARKYFREGDAKRGIVPLTQRLMVFQQNIDKKLNVLLEEHRVKRLELIRNLIEKTEKRLFEPMKFYDAEGKQIPVFDIDGEEIVMSDIKLTVKDLERLMLLETKLAGGVVTGVESRSSMLSAEDISGQAE